MSPISALSGAALRSQGNPLSAVQQFSGVGQGNPLGAVQQLSGIGPPEAGSFRLSDFASLLPSEIGQVGGIGGSEVGGLRRPLGPRLNGPAFGDTLNNAIHQVDQAQKAADAQITAFVAGEQENLHEVMIAMNQAELSLQLMTEVRNRMLETYQELMRMQV